MEVQCILVVLDCRLHLEVRLVANNVVHLLEPDRSQDLVEFLSQVMSPVARQEWSCVF